MQTQAQSDRILALERALAELGLTAHEKRLYLVSLALGSASISTLAEHLGLSRPNVYKVIAGLTKRGLAQFSGGKTKYAKAFVVESPSTVHQLLRKKQEEVSSLDMALTADLPGLIGLYEQGSRPAKVRVLQGKKEFLEAYVRVFEEAEDSIRFFGAIDKFLETIGSEFGDVRIRRRVERNVPLRALALPSSEADAMRAKDAENLRTTRILSGASPFTSSFYLFADKVVFWQPESPSAILVEDRSLATMLGSMYDLLWEHCSS